MKKIHLMLVLFLAGLASAAVGADQADLNYFELRIYTVTSNKLDGPRQRHRH